MDIRESFRVARDRQGIALPLSLIGLMLASIVIVGTLVTATSESALSYAHQDATRSLYTASGALESYVAEVGTGLGPVAQVAYTPPGGGPAVLIDVELLARMPTTVAGVTRDYFSVRVEPVGGGRAVSAMVWKGPFELGIESAATFGGDSRIGGSTIVSDGRDSEFCDLAAAEHAVVHAEGTEVDTIGNRVSIIGSVDESELTAEQLIRKTLGGYSITELAKHIQDQGLTDEGVARFGNNPIWGTSNTFSGTGNNKPSSWHKEGNNYLPKSPSAAYNWYCPGSLDDANPSCASIVNIDSTSYKFILVDAGNNEITIQGDHGQGLILVMNGGIRISGGFIFRGLIVSTHDIDITGTGNKVDGAIVSENEVRVDRPNDSDSEILGNAVVRFNRCVLNQLAQEIGGGGNDLILSKTLAWNELVR